MKIREFKEKFNNIEKTVHAHKIFIFGGGFGEEREASIYTANAVYKELKKNKLDVIKIDPAKKDITQLNYKNAVVFNCLHGTFGESGHLPAILDYLKVPYTFSSVTPSALTADKIFFKSTLKKIGLGAPIDNLDKEFLKKEGFFIHKRISGGGSIGMYIDRKKTTRKGYFTEEFLPGKILSLGVLENGDDYLPLEIVEIKLKNKKFYDKTAKYDEGFSSLIPYKGKNVANIQNITKAIFGFYRA
jgi:D-alanine-D-alanine ligase